MTYYNNKFLENSEQKKRKTHKTEERKRAQKKKEKNEDPEVTITYLQPYTDWKELERREGREE